jgi:hypothetical protein
VTHHLFHAIGQYVFTKLREQLFLDALDRRLAEFRGDLEAGDAFRPDEKGPDALIKIGRIKRCEFSGL